MNAGFPMAAQSIRSTGGAAQTIPKNRSPEKGDGQIPQGAAVSKPPELSRWAVWKAPLLGMSRALVAAGMVWSARSTLPLAACSRKHPLAKELEGGVADPARALRYVKIQQDAKSRRGQRPRPTEEIDVVTLPDAALTGFCVLRSASMKMNWSGGAAQSNGVP